MMTQMIERLGYQVDTCEAGDLAIDHLRENPGAYDLVISDFAMPRMNGGEMALEIHNDFPELPIIIVSGFSQKKLEDIQSENPAIVATLRKPVNGNELSQYIHEALNGRKKKVA